MPSLRTLLEGVLGAAQVALCVVLWPVVRSRYSSWGCEGRIDPIGRFAGDDFVPSPKSALTCAIVINRAPQAIWPWLLQLGCGRAGWYSYDLLDNGGTESARALFPQFQRLGVGDTVPAVPNGSFGFLVAAIDPARSLVLAGTINTRTGQPADRVGIGSDPYFSGAQSFLIEALSASQSILIFRMRVDWNKSKINNFIYRYVLEPVSFVMGRKMLLGLKERIEQFPPPGAA
jgi:hypothetical protein